MVTIINDNRPSTMYQVLCKLALLQTTLQGRYPFHHVTAVETEAQGSQVTFPSHMVCKYCNGARI